MVFSGSCMRGIWGNSTGEAIADVLVGQVNPLRAHELDVREAAGGLCELWAFSPSRDCTTMALWVRQSCALRGQSLTKHRVHDRLGGRPAVRFRCLLPRSSRTPLALKAFAKVKDVKPGEIWKVAMKLDKYAVGYWEERIKGWAVERAEYGVRIGRSSAR
ncbi:uncharacterized protein LAESUDRAFT_729196 [Laetiporus sulphureus 93-53]|uniref:beta-glucosidase n=1 Tax=Laetiporus sulphureus 93-53 TaxID=1314785 RepID=A0A165CSV3_9APHY|nr:uncharacterized protein LAESUDRAFT_729196 [Laetiporus sulphureus 93-53]KZT03377.1 hypothetical protein LAESUDRAFT_729196 [Laetiporus sulphureus 93-53]